MEMGENYSAIGGIYRQYELIYVVADERDVLRVRTNYRQGEDVYLYRVLTSQAQARERFLEYVNALNALRTRPRWYNAVTTNLYHERPRPASHERAHAEGLAHPAQWQW